MQIRRLPRCKNKKLSIMQIFSNIIETQKINYDTVPLHALCFQCVHFKVCRALHECFPKVPAGQLYSYPVLQILWVVWHTYLLWLQSFFSFFTIHIDIVSLWFYLVLDLSIFLILASNNFVFLLSQYRSYFMIISYS